ncbi:MAG TPA: GntR family transcriptional regulator [Verrucomicrobiota bacterium]|nr:GntR family transcriptional regulator [Verrucomicrobiota bacterium]
MNQVKFLFTAGRLEAGDELPTIRGLAERLVLNPNTVVHAYAELAKEGVVVCRQGSGTYVAAPAARRSLRQAVQTLTPKVDALVTDAAHLNVELDEVLRLVRDRHQRLPAGLLLGWFAMAALLVVVMPTWRRDGPYASLTLLVLLPLARLAWCPLAIAANRHR